MKKNQRNITTIRGSDLPGYSLVLDEIKRNCRMRRVQAAISVNRQLIHFYWVVGKIIHEQIENANWGESAITVLSKDLRAEFPDDKGFSPTNLKYMRQFAQAYDEKSLQVVGQIPWGHNQLLLNRLKTLLERLWYAKKTLQNGWSRAVLAIQIEQCLHKRVGKAISNFDDTLYPLRNLIWRVRHSKTPTTSIFCS